VLPAAVQFIGLGRTAKWLLLILQWPLLVAVVMLGLAVLYRYAPDRDRPQWRWVSAGAITATTLWIIASLAFTIYVANFNSYDTTYGSLGGVIHFPKAAGPWHQGGKAVRRTRVAESVLN
jgi:membrane protein